MKRTETETVELANLGYGAAAELFAAEFGRVVENITDPNTKPEATRSVTLKLTLKPNKDRSFCTATIACESKVAPSLPFDTQMYVGVDKGKVVATEYNPNIKQEGVFDRVDMETGEVITEKPALRLAGGTK